jgi:hypothetical protein
VDITLLVHNNGPFSASFLHLSPPQPAHYDLFPLSPDPSVTSSEFYIGGDRTSLIPNGTVIQAKDGFTTFIPPFHGRINYVSPSSLDIFGYSFCSQLATSPLVKPGCCSGLAGLPSPFE